MKYLQILNIYAFVSSFFAGYSYDRNPKDIKKYPQNTKPPIIPADAILEESELPAQISGHQEIPQE